MNKNGIRSFSGHQSRPQPDRRLEIKAGHNGTHVIVMFSLRVENLNLTEEEAESHIKALQASLEALRKHKDEA